MVKSKSKSNPYKGAFYVVAVALVVTVLLVAVQGGGLTGAAAVLLDPSNTNSPRVDGKWLNYVDGINAGKAQVWIPTLKVDSMDSLKIGDKTLKQICNG